MTGELGFAGKLSIERDDIIVPDDLSSVEALATSCRCNDQSASQMRSSGLAFKDLPTIEPRTIHGDWQID
jgi:hypothetical protein